MGCAASTRLHPQQPLGAGEAAADGRLGTTARSSNGSKGNVVDLPLRIATTLLPFLPFRTAQQLLEDFKSGRMRRSSHSVSSHVHQLDAALLLVDVSGFTRLSEAYGRMGTAGCERFSLIVSEFFRRLTAILAMFSGDIDCFAGDAVIVVFTGPRPASNSAALGGYSARDGDDMPTSRLDDEADAKRLREAVASAACCAEAVTLQLSGFRQSHSDSKLHVHTALVAGRVHSAICKSTETSRSETFIIGKPLLELGKAMPLSKPGELIIAPSARQLLAEYTIEGEERDGGCLCLTFSPGSQPWLVDKLQVTCDEEELDAPNEALPALAIEMANCRERLSLNLRKNSSFGSMRRVLSKHRFTPTSSSTPTLSEKRATVLSDISASEHVTRDLPILRQLMTFVPTFVKQRLLDEKADRQSSDPLAELRSVSVLFISGKFQGEDSVFFESGAVSSIEDLAGALGAAIDVAEGQCGGATRQITVDEKGVAAIFAFGLPGFWHFSHPTVCAETAHKVLRVLACPGISFSAGLASGMAFCGLVGDQKQRCEYTIMGDVVNTAARLAGYAVSHSIEVACTEDFKDRLVRGGDVGGVDVTAHGNIHLKGKSEEAVTYVVHPPSRESAARAGLPKSLLQKSRYPSQPSPMYGRESELASVKNFVVGDAHKRLLSDRLLLIQWEPGMGGSLLLDTAASHLEAGEWLPGELNVVRLHLSTELLQPLQFCRSILVQLLDDNHAAKAYSKIEAISRDVLLAPDKLPAILQPFAKTLLQSLRSGWGQGADERRIRLVQSVYIKAIRRSVESRRCVLVVDDLQHMPMSSWRVLKQLLGGLTSSRSRSFKDLKAVASRGKIGFSPTSAPKYGLTVIGGYSSDAYQSVLGNTGLWREVDAQLLEQSSAVQMVSLNPLSNASILSISTSVLNCNGISDELAEYLTGHAKGLPLYAKELCRWLLDQGHVETTEDGSCGIRMKSGQVPPPVHTLIQGQVDQLPNSLVVVLKQASVIGTQFEANLLLHLQQSQWAVATTAETLQQKLETLAQLELVVPVEEENQTPVDGVLQPKWKVTWRPTQGIWF